MQGIAAHLSGAMHVLTPVHPGWDGTARPGWLAAIGDLAAAYLRLPPWPRPSPWSQARSCSSGP